MTIGIVYVGLLVLGLSYAIISGALGWLADLGDADVHVDAGGHLDAGHAHPISGTTVATFITGFGGGGAVAHYLMKWPLLGSLGTAILTGLAVAGAAFAVLELIFKQTLGGGEFAAEEAIGREAEVITAIPKGGAGEVAYVVKGQREQASARAVDGSAIPRGQLVVVERVTGSTFFVRHKG
jgi:hypothetical protein